VPQLQVGELALFRAGGEGGGVVNDLVRYRNLIADSARWEGFPFRADDIIIDTPSKSGTTWMQTLCAMLVLDSVEFGRPLTEISPSLEMQINNRAEVLASLEAQEHRRLVKSHTPLDGVPVAEGVTYVCVARDPRDVTLSFQHHRALGLTRTDRSKNLLEACPVFGCRRSRKQRERERPGFALVRVLVGDATLVRCR
jgi:hypothetical protein